MIPKRQGNPTNIFPSLYHAHHSLHLEDLPFWLQLAEQNPGPILELGCGTGRVLLPLRKAGYQVYGLDIDLEMLRFCMHLSTEENLPHVHLFQADMSQFHLDQLFPLILLPCNTLSTLPLHTVEAMLTCVHSHLQPGGIFAASIPNPALLLRLARQAEAEIEDIFPHPEDHEPVQVSSAWVRDESIFKVSWIYDHLLPDGRVDRLEMSTQHHLYPAGYYLEKFSAAGFHLIQQFGDFNLASYRKDSPSLIFITQRAS